jgi:hypothetical protein
LGSPADQYRQYFDALVEDNLLLEDIRGYQLFGGDGGQGYLGDEVFLDGVFYVTCGVWVRLLSALLGLWWRACIHIAPGKLRLHAVFLLLVYVVDR